MSKPLTLIVFAALLVAVLLLQGCKTNKHPGEKEARLALENHFRKEVYNGFVEVLEVKVVNENYVEFDESQYYDMKVNVKVNINRAFVVSKLFTAFNFEVNEQWAQNFEISMAQAQTQEQKNQIIERFEANSFSLGIHELEAGLGFVKIDGRWRVLNLSLWPAQPGGEATRDRNAE